VTSPTTHAPRTDDEWTIHALNIHGAIFERKCQHIVSNVPGWDIKATNHPVMYPLEISYGQRGEESELDIHALSTQRGYPVSLLIECKKNNPNFVDWNFLSHLTKNKDTFRQSCHRLLFENLSSETSVGRLAAGTLELPDLFLAGDGRETKGSYQGNKTGDFTKTSNDAITKAAYQVALATQAIVKRDFLACQPGSSRQALPTLHYYVPVIVTTARLFRVDFDPAEVDVKTGEIPENKATRTAIKWVVYDYPLPCHLQFDPYGSPSVPAQADSTKLQILIVKSEALGEVLQRASRSDVFGWPEP